MTSVVVALRDGSWLTRERTVIVAVACLAFSLAAFGYIVLSAHGLLDFKGRPIGTDFASFYAAGTAVLHGHPGAPFDPALHHAGEQAIFGPQVDFFAWQYPPFFLLIASPLALLPYGVALAAWQGTTLLLYVS